MEGYEPQWTGVFENWTWAFMKVHRWKIRQDELKDAVQEGARIFAWCLRKTTSQGGRIDNDKWFMRYYQRAVMTWLIDAAAKATAEREGQALFAQHQPAPVTEQQGPLLAALSQDASHELQHVLRVIVSTSSEYFLGLLLQPGRDQDWSRRLCRLCGITVNENIIDELRKLLKQ